MYCGRQRTLLESHLKDVSEWLQRSGINPESELGKEFLRQTRELIEQHYELRVVKDDLKQLKAIVSDLVTKKDG